MSKYRLAPILLFIIVFSLGFFSSIGSAASCSKAKLVLKPAYSFSKHAVKQGVSFKHFRVVNHRSACIKRGSSAVAHMFCKKLKKENYKKSLCKAGIGHSIIDKRTGFSIGSRSHCQNAIGRLFCG